MMFAAAIFTTVATFAQPANVQQQPQIPVIPNDPDVKVGQLENGMRYYIRHNDKQKGLADFYILHDVGAIQEDDSQQGLAHFLEHMAFNGTKNFPGKSLIKYLEKIGVKFGTNLNAGTSWDYTQYLIKDVPIVRPQVVDSALLILHDWSHFIALEPDEIDAERGVIMEELRTRDNASWRSTIQYLKAVGKGSRYEHRNLIGYLDGLKSFDHSALENFYHTWYRPDYQAVVVVGDIDADEVEAKVKALMSDIPAAPADAPKKEVIVIEDNAEPIVSIFSDPEMLRSDASIMFKHQALPRELNNTILAEKLALVNSLGSQMANMRLNEIAMKPDAPFTSSYLYYGGIGICPTLDMLTLSVETKDGHLLDGIKASYTELERIRQHGFTFGELERAKMNVLKREESAYANRNDRKNQEYVRRYIANFSDNAPMPSAEVEWQLDSVLIQNITLEEVNEVFKSYVTDNNQVICVNSPVKEGVAVPTEEQILSTIKAVKESSIEPYKDDTKKVPLIDDEKALKGSKVKSTVVNEELGTTEWTLKNGVRVIVKPTDFKADEVIVKLDSNNGLSNLSDEDFYTGENLPYVMSEMGVSKFSSNELTKQLSGKKAAVYLASTGDYELSIVGTGSPKDLETIMQLLYLQVNEPRFDENDFNTTKNKYMSFVGNLETNPDYIMNKEVTKTLYSDNFRKKVISKETLGAVDFARLEPVYNKLFGNIRNFTVYIIGNVNLDTLKPLVEKYIGSMNADKKAVLEKVDDGVRFVKGNVKNDFRFPMKQPKVGICRIFSGEIPYTLENQINMQFLSQILRSRYTESIREEKGGSYSIFVDGQMLPDFVNKYALMIQFDTNEELADEMGEIVVAELKSIADNGPRTEDVEKCREYMLKNWENELISNSSWLNMLVKNDRNGFDYTKYKEIVGSVTNADIQNLMKKILGDGNDAYIIMRPEKAE